VTSLDLRRRIHGSRRGSILVRTRSSLHLDHPVYTRERERDGGEGREARDTWSRVKRVRARE
jgi:hypothetical protein